MKKNDQKLFDSEYVGPGLNQGYSKDGHGGFNSGLEAREKYMPYHVDQLRIVTNPKIEYEQIDVDKNPDMTKEHSILSVPTFIAFYDGERIGSIGGAVPKARLEALFTNYE